jgi:hypothetical protein
VLYEKFKLKEVLKNYLLAILIFSLPALLQGQRDSLENYYNYNQHILVDKIEREHIPINGNEVRMIPFRVDDKYGFVKNDGKQNWLIRPAYKEVFAVYKEGAIVKKDDGYGLVNESNHFIVPPYYQNLFKEDDLFHGLIEGVIDTALPENYNSHIFNQYYNISGQLLFTERAHDQESFHGNDTLAWFRYGSQYHIRSKTGRLVKAFRADEKKHFIGICDNILVYCSVADTGYNYSGYDLHDNMLFRLNLPDEIFEGVYKLDHNFYGVLGRDDEYYFTDSMGSFLPYGVYSGYIGFFQSDKDFFNQDYFVVDNKETSKKGIIDHHGKIIADFNYSYISGFINGLCFCATDNYESFFMDTSGKKVIKMNGLSAQQTIKHFSTSLQEPIAFYDSLCLGVSLMQLHDSIDGKWVEYNDPDSLAYYFIDLKGNTALNVSEGIKFISHFSEGLAPALNTDQSLGFINKKGEWKIQPAYELSVAGAYPFPYLVVPQFIGGYAYIKAFKGYIDKDGHEYFSGKRMQDHYDFSH